MAKTIAITNDEFELKRINRGIQKLNKGNLEQAEKIFQGMVEREVCAQAYYYLGIIELRRKQGALRSRRPKDAAKYERRAGEYFEAIEFYRGELAEKGHIFSEEIEKAIQMAKS